ncbi:hypothetical protein [Paenibacillus sp. GM2]|uniref:hypothetical protein n=1 Tax=Paenibacillus sp. GM2 TaxID=1622070 RepID=UPI000838B671|nr:hypothetical protein [Paenibacillus sp. GM2]
MKTDSLPLWAWLLIATTLLTQGIGMFLDARRRGGRAWLWGLWGLTSFPLPSVVYLIVVWLVSRRKKMSRK